MRLDTLKDRLAALVGVDLPRPRLGSLAWAQIDAEYDGLSAKEVAELVDWLETQCATVAMGQAEIEWVYIRAALISVKQVRAPTASPTVPLLFV